MPGADVTAHDKLGLHDKVLLLVQVFVRVFSCIKYILVASRGLDCWVDIYPL